MAEEKTLEQLQQENAELNQKVSEREAELEVTKEVNAELTAKVEELSAPKTIGEAGEKAQAEKKPLTIPTETFDVDGVKYKFIAPVFMFKGQRIEAETAITDSSLLSELVAKGVGVITKA